MTDENTPGEPLEETQPAPVEPTAPPAPQVPQKFEGKPVEEIVKSYTELERLSGKQAETLGNLQSEVAYLRGVVEQRGAAPVETAPRQETMPEFDWQNPYRSLDVYYEKRRASERKEQEERQRLDRITEAKANYDEGRESALRQNKRLFDGIEREVEQAVFNSFQGGILNPVSLRNPKTWTMAASLIRLERGEYDKLMPNAPKPVSPTQTEVPTSAKPQTDEDSFELTPALRAEAQKMGLSDKEAQEAMAVGYKAWQHGELKRRS